MPGRRSSTDGGAAAAGPSGARPSRTIAAARNGPARAASAGRGGRGAVIVVGASRDVLGMPNSCGRASGYTVRRAGGDCSPAGAACYACQAVRSTIEFPPWKASPVPGSVMSPQGFPSPAPRAGAVHERARRRVAFVSAGILLGLALAAGSGISVAHADAGNGDHVQAAIPQPVVRIGFPVSTSGVPVTQPATMADLDADGRSEILVVDDLGTLHVLRGSGSDIGGWTQSIGGVPNGPLAVGDLDNDGYPEVVSVTTTGRVRVFGNSGAIEASLSESLPSPPVGGAMLTELDRSGRLAVVVVTENGTMYAFAATGAPYPGWPVTGSARAVSPPFAYVAFDNFPRIGYLGANPDRAQIFFTYAALDPQAAIAPGFAFSPAAGV